MTRIEVNTALSGVEGIGSSYPRLRAKVVKVRISPKHEKEVFLGGLTFSGDAFLTLANAQAQASGILDFDPYLIAWKPAKNRVEKFRAAEVRGL